MENANLLKEIELKNKLINDLQRELLSELEESEKSIKVNSL